MNTRHTAAAALAAIAIIVLAAPASASNTWTSANVTDFEVPGDEQAEALRFARIEAAADVAEVASVEVEVAEPRREPEGRARGRTRAVNDAGQVTEPITRAEAIAQGGGVIDTRNEPEQVLVCTVPASTRIEQLLVSSNAEGELNLPGDAVLVSIDSPTVEGQATLVTVERHVAESTATLAAGSFDLSAGVPDGCELSEYRS